MLKSKKKGRGRAACRRSIAMLCLILLACLLSLLPAACRQPLTTPTVTKGPTVISPDPTPPLPTAQPTRYPPEPAPQELQPVTDYGHFSSGHTLQLPGGIWLDTTEADVINQVHDLLVTTQGQGRPTLSRPDDGKPLLVLQDSTSITFRQIRFGFDRPDWPDQAPAGSTALIKLINSTNIRFEDCAFFGGAGPALLLDASENIVFQNCTFYNQAGSPLETGDAYLPSQIRASDTLFETIASGPLSLNLRDSSFDRCVWVGRKGYQMPVTAADIRMGQPAMLPDNSLPQIMRGILAGRIAYHSDEAKNIILRDNLFTSREVFALYDRLEHELPDLLPAHVTGWLLSGQKAEEAQPGAALDPTLGLKLSLRTQIDVMPAPTVPVTPAASATTPTAAPTQPPAQTFRIYDINRLLADLQGIRPLGDRLDPMITGNVELDLSDQHLQPLLSLILPLDRLSDWLDVSRPDRLLENGRIRLYNRSIIPADFCLRENAGAYAAAHLVPLLRDALDIQDQPIVLYEDDTVCFVESRLLYQGTEINAAAAEHHFVYQLIWTSSRDMTAVQDTERTIQLTFTVMADSARKTLIDRDGARSAFMLADMQQAEQIVLALQQAPVIVAQPDGGQLELWTCAHWTSGEPGCLPLFLLDMTAEQIVLRTVLFDRQCRPVAVDVSVVRTETGYSVHSAALYQK
jgi:hypothetical protein